MVHSNVICPYCGATNPVATVKKESSHKFSIKMYEYQSSSGKEILSYELKCVLCEKEYEYIVLDDISWIRNRLELSDVALMTFKTLFFGVNLEAFYSNIIGVTRPKRKLHPLKKFLHICFEIGGKRAYLECSQTKDKLLGINIYTV